MTSVPFSSSAAGSAAGSDAREETWRDSSLGHKMMWLVLAILLLGMVSLMVGVPVVKERALFEGTKAVGQDAGVVAESVPSADLFAVGVLNGAGEFEAFEDGVVPAGVTSFTFQAGVSGDEGVAVMKLLEKPEGVVLRVDAIEGSPGEFTVSAFDRDAAIHRGPASSVEGQVTYSSVTGKVNG